MEKKFWNYIYSFLFTVILVLLIGIFYNLNKNEYTIKNNVVYDKKLSDVNSVERGSSIPSWRKRIVLLYDLINQDKKEPQLFDKFIKDREKVEQRAKVAIIIDDMGYKKEIFDQIANLDIPIAISILPFLPYSQMIAEEGKEKGMTILLHLPMEPHGAGIDPGTGAIFTTMDEQEIKEKVIANLDDISNIDGVNNHMGSKATEDSYTMKIVLKELKKRNLFFVDSKTSPDSIGYELSKKMGISAAQRNVFLDNEQDLGYIRNQVIALKDLALLNGHAIAIGHPHNNTVAILHEIKTMLQPEGVEIVKLKELLE